MLSKKHSPERNKLDLADPRQVRVLKKRLGVSGDDLRGIVERVGESITAVTKEAESEKKSLFPQSPRLSAPPDTLFISNCRKPPIVAGWVIDGFRERRIGHSKSQS
jgi:Protein of unknown function (DUF3606)